MKREIVRQGLHLALGLVFITLILFYGRANGLIVMSAIFFVGALVSFLAIKNIHLPFTKIILDYVQREHEKEIPGHGALMLTLGCILTLVVFQDSRVIVGSLLVLVIGDAASTLFGKQYGKTKMVNPDKSLEGSLAFFLTGAIALVIWQFNGFAAIITALIGALIELAPIDDNLVVPIACGIALTLLI